MEKEGKVGRKGCFYFLVYVLYSKITYNGNGGKKNPPEPVIGKLLGIEVR